VLEPGELDLELALAGLRALRKDLEDQLGAIQHPRPYFALDVSLLRGRELVVEDHERRVQLLHGARDLLHLAGAGVELRVRPAAPAAHHAVAHDARALDQAHDFRDALFVLGVAEVQAHEDRRAGIGGGLLLLRQPTRRPSPLPG
jgi:hypothetical protein